MQIKFKKQLMTGIGIPLLVILVFLSGLLFFGLDISKQVDNIKQTRDDLNLRLRTSESLGLLRNDLNQIKDYIPLMETVLPDRDKILSLPRNLTMIGRQNQVDVNLNLGSETPATENELGRIKLNSSISGQFNNLIAFLEAVEGNQLSIKIDSIDFVAQDQGRFKGTLNGQIYIF